MKALICTLAAVLAGTPALAAHPLQIEDIQKMARLGSTRISPDGKWVAYTVTLADVPKNRNVTNVWMVPSSGGEPQQLTSGDGHSSYGPRWSPDSRHLYFVSTRIDNKPQIFRLPIGGGEARQITSVPTGIGDYLLSPNGKTIVFSARVFAHCSDMACNEKAAKARDDDPVKVRVITEIPFRRWDEWAEGKRNHLFVMPADGGEARDLTPGDVDSPIWTDGGAGEVAFSPDGREIAFSRYSENESLTQNSDINIIPIAGGAARTITTNKASDFAPKYSPDGRYIAYSATLRPMAEADLTRLFLFDRRTGEHRNVFEALDRSIGSYLWAPDGKSLYVTFEDRGEVPLARLDVDTLKLTRLVSAGTIDDVDVSEDGAFVVYSAMDFSHPKELFRVDVRAGAPRPTSVTLTRANADLLRDIEFGEASSFTFNGWRSEAVQAWQVKPPGFDATKKYPVLLIMHGGPEGSWLNQFSYRWSAQLFAAAGYVVIAPNFHGSTGFGLAFQDSIKGQWGGAPYEDQMKAVDVALTWPYIDGTRLAAAGASYGGYMANWIAGHTDRFRAIVSHAGLYDLPTVLFSTDFASGFKQEFHGTPWENYQALIDQAPVTYAKNFKTPMLITHGLKDYRVDVSQGLAMFQLLQAMRIPSKLVLFDDANHWVLKPADSILWYREVLGWLDRWVKPESAEYRKLTASPSSP